MTQSEPVVSRGVPGRLVLTVLALVAAGVVMFYVVTALAARPDFVKPLEASGLPSSEEVRQLSRALTPSAAPAEIMAFLPLDASEQADPAFQSSVALMGLRVDTGAVNELTTGVWTIRATDEKGGDWEIGLARLDGQIKIVFAEKPFKP